MYLVKTPQFIQTLFPKFIWQMPSEKQTIYLTFDDGPIPEVTPWVLDQLDQFDAKATFFCVGENVVKHPEVYNDVIRRGHSIGNHTYNHLSGWASDTIDYANNVRQCAHHVKSNLFRPPYGRLSPRQASFLHKHYHIVLWDVLSGDFDPDISAAKCWDNVRTRTEAGSIIVFHDSLKAADRLYEVLPKTLAHFKERGFDFKAITKRNIGVEQKELAPVG